MIICALFVAVSAMAQSADSVAFVNAKKRNLKIRGAEGYTTLTTLFGAPQSISVIKFPQKKFGIYPNFPSELTTTSEQAKSKRARFSINACYWNVKTSQPATYVKCDGEALSHTHEQEMPRVNGLFKMYGNRVEVVLTDNAPDYKGEVEDCDNIIACGPVLIDDGKIVSYDHYLVEQAKIVPRNKIRHYSFFTKRHPRSVVGSTEQGDIIFLVVDGRHDGWAHGMTIAELAKVCSWLGMNEALNLDGGGSSTLWSKRYGVVNYPSDNRKFDHDGERKVSSTLVVKRK